MNEVERQYVKNEIEGIMNDTEFGEERWVINSRLGDLLQFIEECGTGEEKIPENPQETLDNENF